MPGNRDLKVVHVETGRHFYGGPQQVIWLIQGLSEAGVDSVLVCPPGSEIDAVARQSGLQVTSVPCAGEGDFGFPFRLRRLLRLEKPDLVHCHSRRGADFPGGWGARMARVPAIVSRRVDSPESPTAAAIRYRPFRKVIAISENIAGELRRSRVGSKKLTVIRSAVDVDAVNPDPDRSRLETEFGIGEAQFAVAVVAQLIKRKGHRFLFDVLPGLLGEHPRIKVVCFGSGPDESHLKELAAKLGCKAAVQFAGFRHDLDDYLGAFDLLVHPAEREGLGVAILKGSAAGLPVIAFNVAGCKEAVRHLKTGILVPPGNVSDLQTAVGAMIEEPDIAAELGAAGRRLMADEFSVAAMVNQHLQLYDMVLHG